MQPMSKPLAAAMPDKQAATCPCVIRMRPAPLVRCRHELSPALLIRPYAPPAALPAAPSGSAACMAACMHARHSSPEGGLKGRLCLPRPRIRPADMRYAHVQIANAPGACFCSGRCMLFSSLLYRFALYARYLIHVIVRHGHVHVEVPAHHRLKLLGGHKSV